MKLGAIHFSILIALILSLRLGTAEELVFATSDNVESLDVKLGENREPQSTQEPLAVTEERLRKLLKRLMMKNTKVRDERAPMKKL